MRQLSEDAVALGLAHHAQLDNQEYRLELITSERIAAFGSPLVIDALGKIVPFTKRSTRPASFTLGGSLFPNASTMSRFNFINRMICQQRDEESAPRHLLARAIIHTVKHRIANGPTSAQT